MRIAYALQRSELIQSAFFAQGFIAQSAGALAFGRTGTGCTLVLCACLCEGSVGAAFQKTKVGIAPGLL